MQHPLCMSIGSEGPRTRNSIDPIEPNGRWFRGAARQTTEISVCLPKPCPDFGFSRSPRWFQCLNQFASACFPLAVGQNQWYHFGVGAPPVLVYFSGDWDVHRGYDLDFGQWLFSFTLFSHFIPGRIKTPAQATPSAAGRRASMRPKAGCVDRPHESPADC